MSFESQLNFTQRIISDLSKVSVSTVSRFIAGEKVIAEETSGNKIKKYNLESTRHIIRSLLSPDRKDVLKKIQVFYNFKGGTGKTSLCYQTATHLAIMGYKVLAIDLDPQGHLSGSLRFEESGKYATIYDVLLNGEPIQDAIWSVFPGLDAIPSNLALTRIEVLLSQKNRREEILKKILDPLKSQYDFILIDTNPTISTLNMNALVAADHINVVCETHPYSLAGLGILIEEMEKFFDDMQLPLSYTIIANKYEAKTATAQEVLGALRADYKEAMLETVVRKCEDINISTKKQLPLCCVAGKRSIAVEDIVDFIHELLKISTGYDQKKLPLAAS